jgi:predicted nucleic acid-binding protein
MKVLLDTNVVLDLLQKREPFYKLAEAIIFRGEKKEITCFLSVNTLSDIFYICTKKTSIPETRSAITYLLENFSIGAIDGDDCKNAMALPIQDFEDALIIQCGVKYNVDYVITRDEELQENGVIKAISPEEFLLT